LVKAYHYKVFNGVRIVVIALSKHVPSHMTIAGHRVLVSYEGQPTTCYGCGETGHFYQVCPKRRRVGVATTKEPRVSWADIAACRTRSPRCDGGVTEYHGRTLRHVEQGVRGVMVGRRRRRQSTRVHRRATAMSGEQKMGKQCKRTTRLRLVQHRSRAKNWNGVR